MLDDKILETFVEVGNDIKKVSKDWSILAMNIQYTTEGIESNGGTILEGTHFGTTIYRYISNTLSTNGYPDVDSFYADAALTNLITTRNVNI